MSNVISREKRLLKEIFVKSLLSPNGYKGVVQNIPVCPTCSIRLDSREPCIDFEFKRFRCNGREVDLIVPRCPICAKSVEPQFYIIN